jgi:hypothetical protein
VAGSLYIKRIFNKSTSWVLAALVLPFLVTTVGPTEVAYAAPPNFQVHVENSLSSTANKIFLYNENTKSKVTFTFDSSGNISEYLSDGSYTAILFPNTDEGSSRTSSNFKFTITTGSITTFTRVLNYLNEKPVEESVAQNGSGYYRLYLGTTGFLLDMLVGSETRTVGIEAIYGSNKYSKPVNPTYLSDGKVVVDIDPGTYTVYGYDANGTDRGSGTCTVTLNTISTCSIAIAAPNFSYEVLNSSGESVTAPNDIWTRFDQIDEKSQIINSWIISNKALSQTALQDGLFNIRVYKSIFALKTRQGSIFRATVAGGVVTELKSLDSNETITARSGVFPLRIKADNFNVKLTAGGSSYTGFYMYSYNPKLGSSWAYPDSLGQVSTNLSEGMNYVQFQPTTSSIDYVSTQYQVTVANGLVTGITGSAKETYTAVSGVFTLPLLVTNVQGTFTLGGVAASGYVGSIYEKSLKQWMSVYATSINSEGKFGINLPRGSYEIGIYPSFSNQNGNRLYMDCEVPASGNTTCNLAAPSRNFIFDIYNTSDTVVATSSNAYVTPLNLSSGVSSQDYVYSNNNGRYSIPLQNGQYSIVIRSGNQVTDGQDRKFTVTVTGGSVTRVVDDKTLGVMTPTDSVYRLTLGAPNFRAVVKANDNPNPNAYINSYQEGFGGIGTYSDRDGKIGFDLPDGRNQIRIYTTGNESPTVVSALFIAVVESGTVTSISNSSGDTLTATSGVYTLNYQIPNIVGTVTVNSEAVSGYINGVWNTVLNDRVDFGGSNFNETGQYAILVPAGNHDVMFVPNGGVGGVQNCNATAGVRTTCNINFPANNFEFRVKNFDGTVLTQATGAQITRKFSKGQSFPGQQYGFGIAGDATGKYQASLVDGLYDLLVQSNSPITDGDSRRFSFEVESGTVSSLVDLDTELTVDTETAKAGLVLVRPNFKAVVKANGSPVSWASIYAYSLNGKGNFWKNINSDSEGRLSLKFPDGEYRLVARPRGNESPMVVRTYITIKIDSGTVTSAVYRNGSDVSSTDSLYTINFEAPNVTGAITVGGSSGAGFGINFNDMYNEDTGNFTNFDFGNQVDGNYGLRIDTGTYLANIAISGNGGSLHRCSVISSANTCNIEIPAENFTFRIQSSSGVNLLEDVGANAQIALGRSRLGYWLQTRTGGIFKSNLKIPTGVTAHYEFNVYTTDGSNRHGISRSYKVSVTGETVTAVTDLLTGTAVTIGADGIYGLRLGAPNLAGTVTGPDGSTPIPNSFVEVSGPSWTGLNTDDSGAFATRLEQDGSYSIWARAPEYDITKADSQKTTVEVAGGTGATNLQLSLRSPTVRGTVSGPTGISPYNYIQVLKKNEYGDFDYVGQNIRPRSTNTQGKFAFYLDQGVYKFQAESDDSNAGGGRTISAECTITDTATVKTCDITLVSYNTKLRILGENNSAYTNANVYFYYSGSKESSVTRPDKTWDYGYTNVQGETKLSLGNGTWNGRVEIYGSGNESPMDLTIEIETGTVKSILSNDGETFTAGSDGYFDIKLPISNLRGTILERGARIEYGASIDIWQQGVDENGFYAGRWSNNGKFAFKAKPGKYTIQVNPYVGKRFSKSSPVRTKIIDCEVPVTGIATCDVLLRSSNFNAKIVTPAGAIFERSHAYIYKVNGETGNEKEFSWVEGTNVMNGQLSSFIETGTYQITVAPHWDAQGTYTQSRFEIISTSGVIQSVRNMKSNETVTAVNEEYPLALSSPSISGRVLAAGSGSTVVRWAQIVPINVATGEELWEYSTHSNNVGKFALSLPNGTYDIVARQWGNDGESKGFTSSPLYRETVTAGVGNLSLDIRMRSPNVTIRVVNPTNSSVGLSDVWLHANFNGQYFGGVTDVDGYFTAFVDTATTSTCTSTCRIYIYPGYQSAFTPRSETFTTVTSIGNISPGIVNSNITIYIPTNGGTGVPNKWSWFSVEELDASNNVVNEQGYGTNELGRAGIGLTVGAKYRITAYPSGDFYGRYSPKSYVIDSFNATTHATIAITFDSPNVTFIVRDSSETPNAWGWFAIFTVSGGVSTRYVDGYLNEQGRGAQYLPDASYSVTFYPGKSKGVEKTITFTISGGRVTNPIGATFTVNDVGTVIMGAGNVTGTVRTSTGELAANIAVTAVSTTDPASKVSTVTKEDGTYELNLDISQSWSIKVVDPITEHKGSETVTANSGSYTGKNITLAP